MVGLARRGSPRNNQATFSVGNKLGAFCEDCPSPDFLRSKKWSSSAAAEFVDGAVAVSGGAPPGQTDEDVSMASQVYRLIFRYL